MKKLIIIVIILLCSPAKGYTFSSINARMRDSAGNETWVYRALDRLKLHGLIQNRISSTKPYTRYYIARLIRKAEKAYNKNKSRYNEGIYDILKRLNQRFQFELEKMQKDENTRSIIDNSYFTIDGLESYLAVSDSLDIRKNSKGDILNTGLNFRQEIFFKGILGKHVSLYLNPVIRANQSIAADNYTADYHPLGKEQANLALDTQRRFEIKFNELYLKLSLFNIDIQIGRDSLWWGPGHHGSLLMTSNFEPLEMLKLETPLPFRLPWGLKYLGDTKISYFIARLEEDRAVPDALLNGIRFTLSPFNFFEMGISYMSQFGGNSRKTVGFGDYWKILAAKGDKSGGFNNKFDNNHLISFDMALTIAGIDEYLPIARGVELYFERGGDDQTSRELTSDAKLMGLYLADIFMIEGLDFRIEYAENHEQDRSDNKVLWYNHFIYKSGYTYKGFLIGHHMGTDAEDIYIRISKEFEKFYAAFSFDGERHLLFDPNTETVSEWVVDGSYCYSDNVTLSVSFWITHINNYNFEKDIENFSTGGLIGISYTF